MRDYGKVQSTFWTSDDMRGLSDTGRLLALYLLTGPHTNQLGCFRLPDGYACEDLGWDMPTVAKGFAELFANGFVTRDDGSKWVFIHRYLKWNVIENPNQAKSAEKLFLQIPSTTPVKALLAVALREYSSRFSLAVLDGFASLAQPQTEPLVQPLIKPLAQPLPNQKQEQDQEQNQKQGATATVGWETQETQSEYTARPVHPLPVSALPANPLPAYRIEQTLTESGITVLSPEWMALACSLSPKLSHEHLLQLWTDFYHMYTAKTRYMGSKSRDWSAMWSRHVAAYAPSVLERSAKPVRQMLPPKVVNIHSQINQARADALDRAHAHDIAHIHESARGQLA